ncbi:spore gernimation protein [Thermoanaerobacterium thermosaccharolyticum]|uniref:Spore germination protein n=1 Tax=Thermoanaerobacterium thermosaccharolyticum TaxID=1517 RepID=A0A231VGA8_THETR|nr:endospore germination permease [Thermoanaerobacterium thermosaccharolyticum]AST57631.1 spore germination protein [Thermoanaerobacterium thermosaccharolyticum]OXT07159.1 spore gernimation protein [Thermoanaerobacterium thermosaccharolyticum]PHO07635.1 spore gernimation protein [Thermoanaerobacterium thermosaccharolyticum]
MIKNNDKISENQLSILLFTTMLGAGILSLPSDVTKAAGPNGLIVILLGGILALIFARFICRIASIFPTETFVEYSAKLMTKPVSVILSIFLVAYFLIFCSLNLRIFGEVAKSYLLNSTPIEVIMITLLFTSGYIVRYGIEPIARLSEILFPIMVIPTMIILFPAITDIDLSNFLPILRILPLKLLKGILLTAYSFVGFEILYVIFPYIQLENKLKKSINISFFSIIFFYIYVTFYTMGIFGYKETSVQLWPLLTVIKSINFPGFFIENLESLIMGIWTFAVFTSISAFQYAATLSLSKLIKAREHTYLVIPLIPIIYFMALIPDSIVEVYKYASYASNLTLFFVIILPILMFIAMKLRGKGMKNNEEN